MKTERITHDDRLDNDFDDGAIDLWPESDLLPPSLTCKVDSPIGDFERVATNISKNEKHVTI